MTRGDRATIKLYVMDMTEEAAQLEIRKGRVYRLQDLGDAETIREEAWEWKAGKRGSFDSE